MPTSRRAALNAFQNRVFVRLLVERRVDVRRYERIDRRRELLQLALGRLDLSRERELHRVEERDRRLAHDDDQLRLHDVQLAEEKGPRLLLVAVGELQAVRPVDRHRVDAQPLQRLEQRVAGAAVERDALLQLRRRAARASAGRRRRADARSRRRARACRAPACATSSPRALISVMAFCRYFS